MIEFEALPDRFRCSPESTAVVVVDMQNDFAAPGGMFDRAGVPIGVIRDIVGPTARVLSAARSSEIQVVYLAMQFKPDLSDAGDFEAPNRIKHAPLALGEEVDLPDGSRGRILVEDQWNTRIIDELQPQPGDALIPKHRYSGFFETPLDERLRAGGVDSLIFAGATTSVCVESTLRDAFYRDYKCVLLSDCTAEPIGGDTARTNHDATLTVVETLFGWVAESSSFLDALS